MTYGFYDIMKLLMNGSIKIALGFLSFFFFNDFIHKHHRKYMFFLLNQKSEDHYLIIMYKRQISQLHVPLPPINLPVRGFYVIAHDMYRAWF